MLFNSFDYVVFFPLVVLIYYMISSARYRMVFLLGASYYFYFSWNPVYLLLLLFSTVFSFLICHQIQKLKGENKKHMLWLGVSVCVMVLFYFKYYNFIAENIQYLFDTLKIEYSVPGHSWILPVGISFYTFQIVGYIIDVYKEKMQAERNFFTYALYVSFFPQLVAGPIERANRLLPQLKEKHSIVYSNFSKGFKLILWGFFKKLVIADRFAIYVNEVYNNPDAYTGMPIVIATVFFVFQVYCDFSAYSDIAIGSAKIIGIDLMENFKGPLLSRNITEIWRRWHISLSTWIRDYLYNPIVLGTRQHGNKGLAFSLILTFTMVGIWHGAAWTFVIFGLLHGIVLSYESLSRKERKRWRKKIPKPIYTVVSILLTFLFWSLTCLIFRANSVGDAFTLVSNMFTGGPDYWNINIYSDAKDVIELKISLILLVFMFLIHFVEYKYDPTEFLNSKYLPVRWSFYLILILSIQIFGVINSKQQFIYFQF